MSDRGERDIASPHHSGPLVSSGTALDPDTTQKVTLDPLLIQSVAFDGDVTQKVRLDPALIEASIPDDDEQDGLGHLRPQRRGDGRVGDGGGPDEGGQPTWLTEIAPRTGVAPAETGPPAPTPTGPDPSSPPPNHLSVTARRPTHEPEPPHTPTSDRRGRRVSLSSLFVISVVTALFGVALGGAAALWVLSIGG